MDSLEEAKAIMEPRVLQGYRQVPISEADIDQTTFSAHPRPIVSIECRLDYATRLPRSDVR